MQDEILIMKNQKNIKEIENISKKIVLELLFCILILFVSECIFMRNFMFSDKMLGDLGDGRFTALSADHWWRFISGKDSFSQIPVFYPNKTAIGYSDLHFAFGLFMIPLRLFGIDIYLAFKISVIAMHFCGLFSMFYLLFKVLKITPVLSAMGTIAFSHCCGLSAVSNHPQLFAVGMMPILLIFTIRFIEEFNVRKKRNTYAFLTIGWFMLLVYTSWYMACFTGMFCLIFMVVYTVKMSGKYWNLKKWLKDIFSVLGKDVFCYLIYTVVLFIPFTMIYIPVMKEGSMYEYSGNYLPDPIDLINVSENNMMFGWLMKLININARGRDHELTEGIAPVLLILFIISAIKLLKKSSTKERLEKMIPATAVISTLICMFSVIRWNGGDFSFWAIVYALLIPMRAVHAVARFLLWLCFPISVLTAYQINKMKLFTKKNGKIFSVVLLGLMIFSTINKVGLVTCFNHSDRVLFLESIANAPEEMQSFYITDSTYSDYPWFASQLDAWEIATVVNKPTLNGYSGHFPNGWGLADPNADYYETYVEMWISENGLQKVFEYDKATNSWKEH